MADELKKYYEAYHETLGDGAYRMLSSRDTSRVKFLMDYISQYTPEGGRVLDVGCGDMYLSSALPSFKWTGIDIAPHPDAKKAIKVDLQETPYPLQDSGFDTAVCSEVLEHLFDLRIVHKEVARLLKPGGYYIISTPNFDYIDYRLNAYRPLLFDTNSAHLFEHIRQYNLSVHKRYLEEAGFSVEFNVGADAHYSEFFQKPRKVLYHIVNKWGRKMDIGAVDQVLGLMFPECSHTILVVARKSL